MILLIVNPQTPARTAPAGTPALPGVGLTDLQAFSAAPGFSPTRWLSLHLFESFSPEKDVLCSEKGR